MRIGVSGKGGVGKTTIAAGLARALARRGHRVVAVDCDSDPNLAGALGMAEREAATLRPLFDQFDPTARPSGMAPSELLERHGQVGPDGVLMVLGALIQKAGAG